VVECSDRPSPDRPENVVVRPYRDGVWSVRLVGSAVVVVALAACGGGDDAGSANGGGTTTTATGSATADAFVGLRKQAAIARAEQEGRPWRIGREDDEQFALTQDYIEDRVTFEIDDGEITKATFG
jgi:hypothetical protein